MGLRAHIDLHDWGFPDETPILMLPIEYPGVGEMFGTMAQEMAAGQCPVDTGYLQSSIRGSGENTEGQVEASAEYAQYVEYGTWKMAAQPYFTSAVEQGAVMAFSVAMQIYQARMDEEQQLLAMMGSMGMMGAPGSAFDMATAGDGSDLGGPTGGGYWGGFTQTINGVQFKQDGSLVSGMNYMMTQPGMWRTNTTMYEIAKERQAHLGEYRARAMQRFEHDNKLRATTMGSGLHSFGSSGRGSGATNFGYSVGMSVMGGIMSSGGSWLGGLLGGMLVGGLATLLGLVLGDIFGSGGPEFSMPEIEIT